MSVSIAIAHKNDEVLDTEYFVEQLKKKWPSTKIHFITAPNSYIFQFTTPDDFGVLGDFGGTCVWYQGHSDDVNVNFALWYRSIVPSEWQLVMYDSGLYFDFISLKAETTADELIAGFQIPFDISKYE